MDTLDSFMSTWQAVVIWEAGTSVKKMPPQWLTIGQSGGHFVN